MTELLARIALIAPDMVESNGANRFNCAKHMVESNGANRAGSREQLVKAAERGLKQCRGKCRPTLTSK